MVSIVDRHELGATNMRVHPAEVRTCLAFTDEERTAMGPSFAFGDAEEQLSYAVHTFGSARVVELIVDAKNTDIAKLALLEVDHLTAKDKEALMVMTRT